MSERRMNSLHFNQRTHARLDSRNFLSSSSFVTVLLDTHLSHIGAYLPHRSQELNPCHPLRGAETSLPRELMQVSDQPLQNVFCPPVFSKRIDGDHIVRDVVRSEILHWRDFDLRGVHLELFVSRHRATLGPVVS